MNVAIKKRHENPTDAAMAAVEEALHGAMPPAPGYSPDEETRLHEQEYRDFSAKQPALQAEQLRGLMKTAEQTTSLSAALGPDAAKVAATVDNQLATIHKYVLDMLLDAEASINHAKQRLQQHRDKTANSFKDMLAEAENIGRTARMLKDDTERVINALEQTQ